MAVNSVRVCALALLALVATAGCGTARAPNTTEVTGNVTLDGKAVEGAAVAFIGPKASVLATATTDSSGNFKLYAAIGKNQVTIAKGAPPVVPAAGGTDMLMPTDSEYAATPQPAAAFPAKYGDPKTSGFAPDVTKGMPPVVLSCSSQ